MKHCFQTLQKPKISNLSLHFLAIDLTEVAINRCDCWRLLFRVTFEALKMEVEICRVAVEAFADRKPMAATRPRPFKAAILVVTGDFCMKLTKRNFQDFKRSKCVLHEVAPVFVYLQFLSFWWGESKEIGQNHSTKVKVLSEMTRTGFSIVS